MRVFSSSIPLAIVLAAVALTGCALDPKDGPTGDLTVELSETGDSGKSGTAALVAEGKKTLVVIKTFDDPNSKVQPVHIHEGTCDELSPESAFALQNTSSGGRSTSTLDVSLDALTSGTYAIALHASDENVATHTSCGNIKT